MNETKYWLWISMIFGTGSRRIWEAMRLFGSAREAYESISSRSIDLRLSESEKNNISSVTLERAEDYIEECRRNGIGVVGCGDAEYPPQLRNIFNPPAVLYYRGNLSCVCGTRAVTAVGARKASDYSINVCREICGELSRNGIVIVSGFALGTDITAHLAAADNGRPTAAVLGCGIDREYPIENMKYRSRILESGGVFITEYPSGTPPHSRNFPMRNRILSALGQAALVFEASIKSGSLITANLAANQGRDVFCMPPADIFSSRYFGNSSLLRDGAELLLDAQSVLDIFRLGGTAANENPVSTVSYFGVGDLQPKKERSSSSSPKSGGKLKKSAAESVKQAVKDESPESGTYSFAYDELTDIQKKIYDAMNGEKIHADLLSERLEIGLSELMTELTELEIAGAVRSLPGKMYMPL